jgi:hypothetical protein
LATKIKITKSTNIKIPRRKKRYSVLPLFISSGNHESEIYNKTIE